MNIIIVVTARVIGLEVPKLSGRGQTCRFSSIFEGNFYYRQIFKVILAS
jgi:hypothetical protein